MRFFSGLFKSRDKPSNSYDSPSLCIFFLIIQQQQILTDRILLQSML